MLVEGCGVASSGSPDVESASKKAGLTPSAAERARSLPLLGIFPRFSQCHTAAGVRFIRLANSTKVIDRSSLNFLRRAPKSAFAFLLLGIETAQLLRTQVSTHAILHFINIWQPQSFFSRILFAKGSRPELGKLGAALCKSRSRFVLVRDNSAALDQVASHRAPPESPQRHLFVMLFSELVR